MPISNHNVHDQIAFRMQPFFIQKNINTEFFNEPLFKALNDYFAVALKLTQSIHDQDQYEQELNQQWPTYADQIIQKYSQYDLAFYQRQIQPYHLIIQQLSKTITQEIMALLDDSRTTNQWRLKFKQFHFQCDQYLKNNNDIDRIVDSWLIEQAFNAGQALEKVLNLINP